MTAARYTPTTDEARDYFLGGYTESGAGSGPESDAAFDRFTAKTKADALREAAAATRNEASGEPYAGSTFNAHANWLEERASQIEQLFCE